MLMEVKYESKHPFCVVGNGRSPLLVVNVGNLHTLAFRLGPDGMGGTFEHHTGFLDQPMLGNFLGHFGYTRVAQQWQLVETQMDYQRRFAEALDRDRIDLILCPACPLPAFTHGVANDLGVAGGYTILHNLLGYPAGVVPFTRVQKGEEVGRKPSRDMVEKAALKVEQGSAGLPVGVQVVVRPWREHIALAVMHCLEQMARTRPDYPKEIPL